MYNAPDDVRGAIKECTTDVPQTMKKCRIVKKDVHEQDAYDTFDEVEETIWDPLLLQYIKSLLNHEPIQCE